MRTGKKLIEKCERLGYLTLKKEEIDAEIKELRECINEKMAVNDSLVFASEEQSFMISKRYQDKAVLKSNATIFKLLEKDSFISIAKINKMDIEKEFGKAVLAECVDRYTTDEVLVLRKVKDSVIEK